MICVTATHHFWWSLDFSHVDFSCHDGNCKWHIWDMVYLVLCQDLVQVKMSFSHSNLPAIPKLPVDTIFQNHRVTYNRNDYEAPSAIWTETAGWCLIWCTADQSQFTVIMIVLDGIQFKMFVKMFCHDKFLLQYDTFIVSLIDGMKSSHFDLYYLYSNTNCTGNKYLFCHRGFGKRIGIL